MIETNEDIVGEYTLGRVIGSQAIINVKSKDKIYRCYINKLRTPDLFESLRNIKFGSTMSLHGKKLKNQLTGEDNYIIYG